MKLPGSSSMKFVNKSGVDGTVRAPASKSMMQRAVAVSTLTKGTTEILNPSLCSDGESSMNAARALGAVIKTEPGEPGKILVTGGGKPSGRVLDCGESGLCLRMFSPIAALFDGTFELTGSGSLMTRPVDMLHQTLEKLGVSCATNNGRLPIKITGPMKGGTAEVDGSVTSQFLTGLLMALPVCPDNSVLNVKNLKSTPYILMTLSLLESFGISVNHDENFEVFSIPGGQNYIPGVYNVEGDWSGAAFLLVAGATAGRITVANLDSNSLQADKAVLDALEMAGARVVVGDNFITVEKSEIKGFEFDATNCPDLFPPLAALGCSCSGKTIIHGVKRLQHKESNRGETLASELGSMGAVVKLDGNIMEITGCRLAGGVVDSHNDHRIAMACACAGLVSENGVSIRNYGAISKSYPEFFDDLESIMMEKSGRGN
jgi:3-phosphoshikimate 1-carboxyvinyltransferase